VRAVASLAKLHLNDGFVVSIETPGAPIARALRGQRMQLQMLDQMARAHTGRASLHELLRRMITDPRRDSHNILVTPSLDHSAAAMLKLLLDRGGSLTFVHVRTEDTDAASSQRAAALGCEVVELRPGMALETVFRRGTGAGIRR
jgi:hypothetical protein